MSLSVFCILFIGCLYVKTVLSEDECGADVDPCKIVSIWSPKNVTEDAVECTPTIQPEDWYQNSLDSKYTIEGTRPVLLVVKTRLEGNCDNLKLMEYVWNQTTPARSDNEPLQRGPNLFFYRFMSTHFRSEKLVFEVTLTVTNKNDITKTGHVVFSVSVKFSLLVPVLSGAPTRLVETIMNFDARYSYDPEKIYDISQMKFTWICMHREVGLTWDKDHGKFKRSVLDSASHQLVTGSAKVSRSYQKELKEYLLTHRSKQLSSTDCSTTSPPITNITGDPFITVNTSLLSPFTGYHLWLRVSGPNDERTSPRAEFYFYFSDTFPSRSDLLIVRCRYNCFKDASASDKVVVEYIYDDLVKNSVTRMRKVSVGSEPVPPHCVLSNDRIISVKPNCFVRGRKEKINIEVQYMIEDNPVDFALDNYLTNVYVRGEPKQASCSITPKEGFALITSFEISCSPPPYTYTYTFMQTVSSNQTGKTSDIILSFATSLDKPITLHMASDASQTESSVKVYVEDNNGDFVLHYVNLMIKPFPYKSCKDKLHKCMTDSVPQLFDDMWRQGDIKKMLNIAQVIAHELALYPESDPATIVTRQQLRETIVTFVKRASSIVYERSLQQIAMFLQLFAIGNPLEISLTTRKHSFELLNDIAVSLKNISRDINSTSFTRFQQVSLEMTGAASKLYAVVNAQSTYEFAEELFDVLGKAGNKTHTSVEQLANSFCEMETELYKTYKNVLLHLTDALEPFIFSNEPPFEFRGDTVQVKVVKAFAKTLRNATLKRFDTYNGYIWFDMNDTTIPELNASYLQLFAYNHHLFPGNCTTFKPGQNMFHFAVRDDYTKEAITNELGRVHYIVNVPNTVDKKHSCRGMYVETGSNIRRQDIYKILLAPLTASTTTSLVVIFLAVANVTHPFTVEYGPVKPKDVTYDSWNDVESHGNKKLFVNETQLLTFPFKDDKTHMYVTVSIDRETSQQVLKDNRDANTALFYYYFEIYHVGCNRWDEETGKWSNSPSVMPIILHRASVESFLQVECVYDSVKSTHAVPVVPITSVERETSPAIINWYTTTPAMTTSTSTTTAPTTTAITTTITTTTTSTMSTTPTSTMLTTTTSTMSTTTASSAPSMRPEFLFLLAVPYNPTIWYFVGGALLLYLLLLILSCCIDCHRPYMSLVTVLRDVDPNNKYAYLVSVSADSGNDASESSLIAVVLKASEADSDVHILTSRAKEILTDPAGDEHYLIFTDKKLGELVNLALFQRFFIDPESTSMFLKKIIISDLQSKEEWKIDIKKKLTQSTNELYQMEKVDINDYGSLEPFSDRLKHRFIEYYLLTCFFCRHRVTEFTCAQRLTVFFLFLFLAVFINLVLRGLPSTSPVEHIGEYGFRVLARDIVLACVTALILLPFSLLLLFFVRYLFSSNAWIIFIDLSKGWKKDLEMWKPQKSHRILLSEAIVSEEHLKTRRHRFAMIRQRLHVNVTLFQSLLPRSSKFVKTSEEEIGDYYRDNGKQDLCIIACTFLQCAIGLLLWLINIVLIILIIVYGLRLSVTASLLWLFSSLVGFAICILLLHPLFLLIYTVVVPLHTNRAKKANLRDEIPSVLSLRNRKILKTGSIVEYQEYLQFLRQQPMYQLIYSEMHAN